MRDSAVRPSHRHATGTLSPVKLVTEGTRFVRRPSRRTLGIVLGACLLLVVAGVLFVVLQRAWSAALDRSVTRSARRTLSHPDLVHAVAFSPDGRKLATGGADRLIRLWDPGTGSITAMFVGHDGAIRSLAFSPDGRTLVSGGADQTIKLWDLASGQLRTTLTGHAGEVTFVAVSHDGQTLASSSSEDATIWLWDVAERRHVTTLAGHGDVVNGIAFAPDDKTLVSASDDGTLRLWEAPAWERVATMQGNWANRMRSGTGSVGVRSVALSPNGRLMASGDWTTTVILWDLSARQKLVALGGHRRLVRAVAFAPDGHRLASGSDDGSVRLWTVPSGHLLALYSGHEDNVYAIAFSPDGRTLASASGDRTVKLWDTPR